MTDDFSNYPESVKEVVAQKKRDGREWTPRDALISVLRDIDNGKIDPYGVVVGWIERDKKSDNGGTFFGYAQSSPSHLETCGLTARLLTAITND